MRVLTLLGVLTSLSVFAADLKPVQEEAKAAFDKQMKSIVAEVNTACGTSFVDVTSDFENYDKKNFPQMPPGQTCSSITYALKTVCKSEPYKKAVMAKVKGLSCLMKAGSKTPYEFPAGVFTYNMVLEKQPTGIDATNALKTELDK
ncbi:MAG: hypothetical protein Q8S33_10185 [Myxococcales bacterium]|nr:hypothetical protein [Myxococcales bacterium]MDP3500693.1 hypothetical protein [Myxococcales bacterium]